MCSLMDDYKKHVVGSRNRMIAIGEAIKGKLNHSEGKFSHIVEVE